MRFVSRLAGVVALLAVTSACRSPTQIILTIDSDESCDELNDVSIFVGSPEKVDSQAPVATTDHQAPTVTGCRVGTLVLTPSGSSDADVAVKVVGGFGSPSRECIDGSPTCVVARRALSFIEHKSLDVPVTLYGQCRGVPCDPDKTCNKGVCVSVVCSNPSGCAGPDAGADGGGLTCQPGSADCNGTAVDGCEVALDTDTEHCGQCNRACNATNASPTCVAGTCSGSCNTGWADCNGDLQLDGCETSVATVDNCGKCGVMCAAPPNASAACVAGKCALGECTSPSRADCDGDVANGCEVWLPSDDQHCGACGVSCGPSDCALGRCQVLNSATGQSCTQVCSALGKKCQDIGINNGAQGGGYRSAAAGFCQNAFGDCSTVMVDRGIADPAPKKHHKCDWTYCKCG